jgi:hypothetical protein
VAFPPENWPTDFHPLPSVDPVIGKLASVGKYKPLLANISRMAGVCGKGLGNLS